MGLAVYQRERPGSAQVPSLDLESTTDVFRRLGLGDATAPEQVLRTIRVSDTEVHAPCPLYESLEWKLSSHYWREAGLLPFLENSVPYVVNNSGRLSENSNWKRSRT